MTHLCKVVQKRIKKLCSSPFANISSQWSNIPAGVPGNFDCPTCEVCNGTFASTQKLSVHRFRKHGLKHQARRHIDTTFCTVCLKEFWSRARAVNHVLDRFKVCLHKLVLKPMCLTEAQIRLKMMPDTISIHWNAAHLLFHKQVENQRCDKFVFSIRSVVFKNLLLCPGHTIRFSHRWETLQNK